MLYFSNAKAKPTSTVDLFDTEPKEYPLPELKRNKLEDAFDEIELLGFPLCNPFDLLASKDFSDTVAKEMPAKNGNQVRMVGYLVTTKDAYTMKNP